MRSSKSLKPNNLAKLRITPNRSIQFGEMLRRGKMDRRRQPLLQSAPDLLYKEALSEPYNSAKSPGKPLVTGAFCSNGVEKVPTKIVSNPSRDGGGSGGIRTHVPSRTTAFRVRLVTTTSIRFHVPLRGTGRPGNGSPCSLEVPPGFEPGNEGFADLCLTTWLWHQIKMER